MKRLVDCLGKTSKLINKADADALVLAARALEAEGMSPIAAEQQVVKDAQAAAISNGASILSQIRAQRPQAYQQATDFWNRETLRKAVEATLLPRFVTEGGVTEAPAEGVPAAPVPVDQILAVHNAPDSTGSTVNAVHGDLGGTNSYSFSIFPDLTDTVPGKIITAEQINKFAAKAQAAGIDVSSQNISIGTWYDRETDTTFLDVAFTTTDRAEAIRLGNRFNQKAVFDLSTYTDIPLEGTGIAPENLPSIAERIGVLFQPGYDVGRHAEPTTTQAQGAPSAPGAPAPAQGTVAGGAQGGQPEVGGVHEEVPSSERVEPPEIPAAPISDAAQEVVNNLPEEQRNAAQKAFARDDRDLLADDQRSKGQPVEKRRNAPVAPEKNKGLLAELSKYGVWDKPVTEVLKNIASDPKQPRWVRALTDLLVQLGLGEGVDIRVVNTPNAIWPALYDSNRKIVYINLSYKGDLARRLLHELLHHGTLNKLTNRESSLTPAELAAKRALQDMFNIVRKRREFKGVYGASRLHEFVSEVFANDSFRRKLNSIRPDGRVSILQRIRDSIRDLLIGDLPMRRGSLLDAAIKEAINVAGSRAVETSPRADAAARERGSIAARQANGYPNFQEQIAETIAPMADNMGISDNDLIERELDHKAAFYADDERAAVESAVDERAGKINATPAEIADVKKRIEEDILYNRAYHPANAGWANKAIKVLGLEDKKGLTRGDPTKQNPSGIVFKVKYKDTPYTYARAPQTVEEAAAGKSGQLIQRFLKPSKKSGREKQEVNSEWTKRVGQLANKMFDNLQGIMARRGKGDDSARIAQVIVDQINWYRDMRTRLRAEFGSMSDYVADVIAGFSPITDVPGNWNNFVDYFRHVMKGDYDEAFRKFDEYISADPENRSSGTYKKEFPPEEFPDLWPRKLFKEDQPLFGANTGNALTAGLDLWRAVESGTAPKARNFGLNLIGQSLKATIDRWAARYLQRMHAPTWRLPPSIEGSVTGAHMPGENVELVSGDFGMGQDVFEDVAKRLQESGHEIFKEVTAADLQAILWFAEKEVWEMRKWTDIMGAGSSMNVVAQATAAQRYEAGAAPGKTSAKDEKLMAETIELRTNLNAEAHMLGAKMVPSVNITDGKESKTFDGEWVTEPEYDPENSIGHVARIAARLGKKAAHISRVIVNEFEPNPEMTPGLHIFFKGRVGDAQIKGVMDKLKAVGITNGISLTVDPRVRPEIIKSLDPKAGANQYNGVRVQFVPQYDEAAKKMTRDQIDRAFANANNALANDASVAEARVLYYDTLVMEKGVDYDSSGKLTKTFSDNRKRAWVGRARSEGAAAAARRDNVQKAIADRKRQDLELESRMEREQQERIAAYAEFQRSIQPKDRANDGGVDPPTVAAMQYEDQQEPLRDPHGGRASLVRSMVERIRNVSRDREGIEVPQSAQEVRGVAGAGSGAAAGRKGSAPLWRSLGATFRAREASLYQGVESAAALIRAANPEDPENPKDPARYENSQKLFDYLSGKETPSDPELKSEITELRKEIPVVSAKAFEDHGHLDSGSEADVFHDTDSGVVYKLFNIKEGKLPQAYVPGQIRLDRGQGIRIGMGEKPTITDLLTRMERANTHRLTPHELVAVTPEGQLVFAQPYVEGRGVTQKNLPAALARAGVHFLSDLGATSGVAKLEDGRWVVYDDLHPGNVRTMPGGRVEIIDANNRELDQYEINDLHQLGKMPMEKPKGAKIEPGIVEPVTVAAMAEEDVRDDRDLSVAPMAATGANARYPWPWRGEPEKVVGYKPGGLLAPQAQLSKEVSNFVQERERREKAVAYRAESLVRDLERALKAGYGKQGPDKAQMRDVQIALGNLENRMTPEQYNESLKYTGDARLSFIETARHESVEAARERQRVALGNLPDIVREKVNALRDQLDLEAKELLKDPGIDTELRARINSESGVLLHSNSYQHFENDVWGKHIKKSNDPEAQRIRRNAEVLFKNEILGEKAHEYQVAQAKAGNPGVTDADALAHAALLPNIGRMVENRLGAYLRKGASEPTRIHLLTGKITIPESDKLLSLNRENLPQEVKELWGQWTDPKINFVKTYTILANHNASIRMQHSIVEDGMRPETGYIWKPDPADPNALPPADLVPLGKQGDDGPLADAYGPQYLKDGLANYSKPQVQDLLVSINRWALMMKTTGNIASAVHNFFGNIAFSVSNGNLLWAVTLAPKTLISSFFESFAVAGGRATGWGGPALQEKAAEMIELGVFDSDIAIGTLRKMAKASQAGILVEKKLGPAAGLQAVMKVLQAGATKTGAAFKETYQAADNWWKYFNYRIELAKQQWIHSGDAGVTLDQMKRNAANMVMDTLPSYSRVPELVRRGLGDESVFKYTGAFFTFQTESARTVARNVTHAWRELAHGKNKKEQSMAVWRLVGMMAMLSLPYALGLAARRRFGYDDEDEEALRNSLPEYQKNASLLIMLPKDEKGNPRYMDLSWLNPYGIVHSAGIAASRAKHKGKGVGAAAGAAAWSAVQPLITVQPGVGTVMDLVRNQDSLAGGKQIYNPENTVENQLWDVGKRAMRGLAPGTLQNVIKATESALGYVGPSGREPDPLQDITAGLAGLPRVSALELDRAMAAHVSAYKKSMGDSKALLNEVVGTKATVAEGEIAAAYEQANARAFEHFSEMKRAYDNMLELGMKKPDVIKAMQIGFGSEIIKGGLDKDTLRSILSGQYQRLKLSKRMEMDAMRSHPERLKEYREAMAKAERMQEVQ